MTDIKKNIPGKRIKAWHRAAQKEGVINSLRSFARALAGMTGLDDHKTAVAWLAGKGIKP